MLLALVATLLLGPALETVCAALADRVCDCTGIFEVCGDFLVRLEPRSNGHLEHVADM